MTLPFAGAPNARLDTGPTSSCQNWPPGQMPAARAGPAGWIPIWPPGRMPAGWISIWLPGRTGPDAGCQAGRRASCWEGCGARCQPRSKLNFVSRPEQVNLRCIGVLCFLMMLFGVNSLKLDLILVFLWFAFGIFLFFVLFFFSGRLVNVWFLFWCFVCVMFCFFLFFFCFCFFLFSFFCFFWFWSGLGLLLVFFWCALFLIVFLGF